MLEILRETWKRYFNNLWACVVVYKHVTQFDGVSTWAKFEGHHRCPMLKYLPFLMYCEVCCCLHVKQVVYKHLNT